MTKKCDKPTQCQQPEKDECVLELDGLLDPSTLTDLKSLGQPGDDSFLSDVLKGFFESSAERLSDIRSALSSSNCCGATNPAHGLLVSSRFVGLNAISPLAAELEEACKACDITRARALLFRLEAEVQVAQSKATTPTR